MNRLRAALRNAADTLSASVQLRAHEIRTGITVIDAVAADDLNTQLLVGTGNPAIAHDLRVIALELMKNGVRPDEIRPLAALHQRLTVLDARPDDVTMHDVLTAASARSDRERAACYPAPASGGCRSLAPWEGHTPCVHSRGHGGKHGNGDGEWHHSPHRSSPGQEATHG